VEDVKERSAKIKDYWMEKLSGNLIISQITADNIVGDSEKNLKKDYLEFCIPEKVGKFINKISRESYYGIYMVLLTGVNYLLYKYTDNQDIILGAPMFNGDNNLNSIIILRNNINKNMTFKQLLLNVRTSVIEAKENMNCSMDEILRNLNIDFKIFNVMAGLSNIQGDDWIKAAESDILFDFSIKDKSINFRIHYSSLLFNKETVQLLGQYLINYFNDIYIEPNKKIKEINIIPDSDKERIVEDFNNTHFSYDRSKTIQELFEEQVRKTPDKIAVIFKDKKITYKELNKKVNKVARVLRKCGVKTNEVVGLLLNRSIEMVVALLAIVKSGATYMPLDPGYPDYRIQYMIENSNTKIMLSESLLTEGLEFHGTIIDIKDAMNSEESDMNLEIINDVNDSIYVIYTSGSTGKPKGVLIKNISVSNLIEGFTKVIDVSEDKTMLSTTTICFDIFVIELLMPLTRGLKLVLATEEQQIDPIELNKVIVEKNIDVIQMTPSRMQLLMSREDTAKCVRRLTEILVAGEAFPMSLLEKLKELTKAKIYNLYGPTEATVYATIKDLTLEHKITIGKPIMNTQAYILDDELNVQPIGVNGELYISGDGVAKGYYNRSDLTEERFIDNPFRPGKKMYRTGDLARWRYDGEIEYMGRKDAQVKIRGYRIELSEIEYYLLKNDSVKEVAVICEEDENAEKHICAYISLNNKVSGVELRKYLLDKLPEYMIPEYIRFLDELPKTPNGKIDKKNLKSKKVEKNEDKNNEDKATGKLDDVEDILDTIYKGTLKLGAIGKKDNIFEAGANSLKIVHLFNEIDKIYPKQIKVMDIISNPTIEKLSNFIKEKIK